MVTPMPTQQFTEAAARGATACRASAGCDESCHSPRLEAGLYKEGTNQFSTTPALRYRFFEHNSNDNIIITFLIAASIVTPSPSSTASHDCCHHCQGSHDNNKPRRPWIKLHVSPIFANAVRGNYGQIILAITMPKREQEARERARERERERDRDSGRESTRSA